MSFEISTFWIFAAIKLQASLQNTANLTSKGTNKCGTDRYK